MPEAADEIGRPVYKKIADDIRLKIAAGEYKVGESIPSTTALMATYEASNTAVRTAVRVLREEGLVVGQPGKAVYVRATPDAVAGERVSAESLGKEVAALRAEVRTLTERVDALRPADDISAEVDEVRKLVELVQAHLRTLYDRLGQPYPAETSTRGSTDAVKPEADRRSG